MNHLCPICQKELEADDFGDYVEYNCFPPHNGHSFAKRIKGEDLLKIKFRLGPNSEGDRIYLKVNFDEGFSQVWTRPGDRSARIRINHVFMPDFSDLGGLQKKIRTYLTFS